VLVGFAVFGFFGFLWAFGVGIIRNFGVVLWFCGVSEVGVLRSLWVL